MTEVSLASGQHQFDEDKNTYFQSVVCGELDRVYRFCYGILAAKDASLIFTKKIFSSIASKSNFDGLFGEEIILPLLQKTWAQGRSLTGAPNRHDAGRLFGFVSKLSLEQRLSLVSIDGLGFTASEFEAITGWKKADIDKHTAEARQRMVKAYAGESSLDLPTFMKIGSFLDEELSLSDQSQMQQKFASDTMNLELDKFRTARGQFQIDLQEISVTETDLTEVRAFVAEPSVRETIEARKIESFEYREKISNIKRRIGIVSLAIVVISILTYVLTPSKQTSFRALDYVGYEALAIEEDADGRVDLPSDDIIEIERYLSQDPSLGFKPRIMRPKNWHPEGASVIDYDGNKVSVAYYSNPQINEKIFHFQTQGTLSQLPRGPLGKVGKITYQTFTQDRVNIIVWQESDQVLSMLVGHRGAEELAKIADESI